MDLTSSETFWRLKNGMPYLFPSLGTDIKTEALVIGGGISGALICAELIARNIETTLIEKYEIGAGSTSASTALIQYELDSSLIDLEKKVGSLFAETAYQACYQAMDKLRAVSQKIMYPSLEEKKSFYLASKSKEVPLLEKEVSRRKSIGLPVDFISEDELSRLFSFSRPGALVSRGALQIDPHSFALELLAQSQKAGLRIFDRTPFSHFTCLKSGWIEVHTENGHKITTKNLIFAVGYESVSYLPKKICSLHSSFAVVSKPLENFEGWFEESQLWETKRPYLYLRTTKDRRALIGGLDEPFSKSALRDRLVPLKEKKLLDLFSELFPAIPFIPAYSWGGTFAETKDSLPYIGSIKKYPGVYFSCGFGGNGITFSTLAADLIADQIQEKASRLSEIFGFSR